jgi:alginate O-acetyltransferase complex protein AlgI
MIFNSVTFIVFLVTVVTLYWFLPPRERMWMLLIASCTFYGFWRWEFLSVMFVSALTDYFTARAIHAAPVEQKRKRRLLLAVTLMVNVGLLAYFKYLFFFTTNVNSALHMVGVNYSLTTFQIILPLGISFYTFETISYTVDVYRRLIPAEKSFLNYGLFVTFFPKLVAGPIQRAAELLVQLKNRPVFNSNISAKASAGFFTGCF